MLVLLCTAGDGQEKAPVTFGKVTPADFAISTATDTAAGAIVVADVGVSGFDPLDPTYTLWEGYLLRKRRVIILKRSAFEAATVTIPLYRFYHDEDEIADLQAATYTLEGGKVIRTDLDKSSLFRDRLSENYSVERFTLPAVREGAIIEYSYKLLSPFLFNEHSWPFQGRYPCLWSEYSLIVPSIFGYAAQTHSRFPFYIQTAETKAAYFGSRMGELKTYRWVIKDVPALREEPFTTTINNYVARIDVQVESFQNMNVRVSLPAMGWRQLIRSLLQSDRFGADLAAHNSWLDDDLKRIVGDATDDAVKARRIYSFVRDNFNCNGRGGITMSGSLKTVFRNRTGSEAELNLLLTAMLEHEQLKASPVLLSTRTKGFMERLFPQLSQLIYVVCELKCGSAVYYLDASDPDICYGQLPLACYNGYGLKVDTGVRWPDVVLSADSIIEQTKAVVFLSNGDKNGLDGSVQYFPGAADATEIRKKMKKDRGMEKYQESLRAESAAEENISDLEIDSLRVPDEPLTVSYSCHLDPDNAADQWYFTPTVVGRITVNPFKAAEREYPVEMLYATDRNYIFSMEIPKGYDVAELPKSTKVYIGDGGYFEYILSQDGDAIQLRTRLKLLKANYGPGEYAVLRNFYNEVVEKENEQIVFKKKK